MPHLPLWPPLSHLFSPPHDRSIWIDYICPLWPTPTSWHPGIERCVIWTLTLTVSVCSWKRETRLGRWGFLWVGGRPLPAPFHPYPSTQQPHAQWPFLAVTVPDVLTHPGTHKFHGLYLHFSHLHMHTPGVLSSLTFFSPPAGLQTRVSFYSGSPRGAPAPTLHRWDRKSQAMHSNTADTTLTPH